MSGINNWRSPGDMSANLVEVTMFVSMCQTDICTSIVSCRNKEEVHWGRALAANELLKETKWGLVLQPVMLKHNKNSHLSQSPLIATEQRWSGTERQERVSKCTFVPPSNGHNPPAHQVFSLKAIVWFSQCQKGCFYFFVSVAFSACVTVERSSVCVCVCVYVLAWWMH